VITLYMTIPFCGISRSTFFCSMLAFMPGSWSAHSFNLFYLAHAKTLLRHRSTAVVLNNGSPAPPCSQPNQVALHVVVSPRGGYNRPSKIS
jgi:hypothetical protein